MVEMVRCPACRGSKRVPKLGGMIGDCNTCNGNGLIKAVDKPVKVEAVIEDVTHKDLINAVADCIPPSSVQDKFVIEVLKPVEVDTKIDGKKALYRRKVATK
jgi:hypothetical protein